jgi:crotonobetainyl-CoA:carnitine CoA-transferase CaiB-like acyl-CoA transferase
MENVEALESFIKEWTVSLTAADLLAKLQAIGVPSAKVARVSELVDDPHLAHRGQILNMDHPKAGRVPMQGFSVHFGESPMQLRHPPPMLGEHTSAILQEWLDMTPERIAQLRTSGAI